MNMLRRAASRPSSSESPAAAPAAADAGGAASSAPPLPIVKVALIGDAECGKTSLMMRYTEGTFDWSQEPTQGVEFMEKTVSLREGSTGDVSFSIWDIGGHKDYESMLPLVCNDAVAIVFVFDLTRPESLDSVREWHRKVRALNKCAMPFLVGCKFDKLLEVDAPQHEHIVRMARAFAAAMDSPLLFASPAVPINVANLFKVILIRLFDLAPVVPPLRQPGEPLRIYEAADIRAGIYVPDPDPPAAPARAHSGALSGSGSEHSGTEHSGTVSGLSGGTAASCSACGTGGGAADGAGPTGTPPRASSSLPPRESGAGEG